MYISDFHEVLCCIINGKHWSQNLTQNVTDHIKLDAVIGSFEHQLMPAFQSS